MNSNNWARLSEGNNRWVQGRSRADDKRGASRRAELAYSQNPFALVLGCADSRVPAEILFDQGLGDLFVVRTAGHTVDSAVLGSLEYAVEVLGVELLVVLGHEGCGAVAAAARVVDEVDVPHGYIRDVAEKIAPNVLRARLGGAATPEEVGAQHAAFTLELLRERSSTLDAAVRRGALDAVAAQYCLQTGRVTEVLARPVPQLMIA
ncbi:beta-carbonic anhydrase CanB [Paractinoplanes ferrugineus]|uniref:Carbonic anhydrase n=1 Tax=Paractinoplanes ferrugineus TaxID=113564 RepID=A0A919IYV3_9ACTN|nr:carbonic anhydrase [Actinoplanes ferrugineus]GIE10748.1 carbonic anhydrase 2 [Actinoplanes ferrugineus]